VPEGKDQAQSEKAEGQEADNKGIKE